MLKLQEYINYDNCFFKYCLKIYITQRYITRGFYNEEATTSLVSAGLDLELNILT